MKTYWLISIVLLTNVSLLLVNDYFPGTLAEIGIPPLMLFAVMAAMIVLIALRLQPQRDKHFLVLFPLIAVVYPLLLLFVLTALGGESKSGFSLTSPILWIGVLVTLATFRRTYRKASQDAESA
ncbi:hypothetical protein [Planococcus sp. ISL-109]|uniref:hypothetical protein n=1 Tax=Planococcus sp. ISL-109 TaxID=2819166 RepID=UPI001BE6BD1C|nr:hypothetical protein [Planococcus sp. ISL-109]MBT2582613.1 hypothetical protein [Planococcus sp. ISL-109]